MKAQWSHLIAAKPESLTAPPGQRAASKQTLAPTPYVLCSFDTDGKYINRPRYALDKRSNFCCNLLHCRYVEPVFSQSNLLMTTSHDLHIPPLPLGLCSPTADCSFHSSCVASQDPTSSSNYQSSLCKTLRPTTRPWFLRQISIEQQTERWMGKSSICTISETAY